jgi:polysaccharide deacetylase family protein (PEP-CTERM system associated)
VSKMRGELTDAVVTPRVAVNALSFDVEDYFQVEGFADVVPRGAWDSYPSRVVGNTERILEILHGANTRATFFILGWVAERFPGLVRDIVREGHEVASHGYGHETVTRLSPAQFREDVRRSLCSLAVAGAPILGYRAPNASIGRDNLWALDVLIEEGLTFDSSIFPGHYTRYGISDWEPFPHRVKGQRGGSVVEFPLSTMPVAGLCLPMSGGFFRFYPVAMIMQRLRSLNAAGSPGMLYVHPWELDPEQPRIPGRWKNRARHYWNLDETASRLARVIREFSFAPVRDVLDELGFHCRREQGSLAAAGVLSPGVEQPFDPSGLVAATHR